jgi:hypothetical protein
VNDFRNNPQSIARLYLHVNFKNLQQTSETNQNCLGLISEESIINPDIPALQRVETYIDAIRHEINVAKQAVQENLDATIQQGVALIRADIQRCSLNSNQNMLSRIRNRRIPLNTPLLWARPRLGPHVSEPNHRSSCRGYQRIIRSLRPSTSF